MHGRASAIVCFLCARAAMAAITVNPGDDVAAIVTANPPGTTFQFNPGTYRLTSTISPKDNDTFVGSVNADNTPLVVLDGSKVLSTFTQETINGITYYVAGGQTQNLGVDTNSVGHCLAGYRCTQMEQLYFDSIPLRHAPALATVVPGAFFFDYTAAKIYMLDVPQGHTVETSVTKFAFNGNGINITIRYIAVQKYANPSQTGAINANYKSGWVCDTVEVLLNHGGGIRLASGGQILNSYIHSNGEIGLIMSGTNPILSGNEISLNNNQGFDATWEGGGTKLFTTTNMKVNNNWVHDNIGPGLWTDTDNQFTTFESNRTYHNRESGILHEMSFDATIRYNVVEAEYSDHGTGLFHSGGIFNSHSNRMTVYNNTVLSCNTGIGGYLDARGGTGPGGESYSLQNFNVHDNIVVQASPQGQAAGIVKDASYDNSVYTSYGNQYTNNSYKLYNLAAGSVYQWTTSMSRTQWTAIPQDAAGTFVDLTNASIPSTRFNAGNRVKATQPADVWSLPSTADGTFLGTVVTGTMGSITRIRGPIRSGTNWWWQVNFNGGPTGWTLESSIVQVPQGLQLGGGAALH